MTTPRDELAGWLRSAYIANRPLFGDTGANPAGFQRLADEVIAVGWREPEERGDCPVDDVDLSRSVVWEMRSYRLATTPDDSVPSLFFEDDDVSPDPLPKEHQ